MVQVMINILQKITSSCWQYNTEHAEGCT